jgi:enoyl-CoA hydratase/carnithine racemase
MKGLIMELIYIEHHDHVAVIKLNRGTINNINLQLVNTLSTALENITNDAHIHSLVLCSTNDKFFSIGLDIPELFGLGKKDFMFFYKKFNQLCLDLFTLPKPTVAALTGHAIAGGCILALCCDYRFIAEGRKLMGLNEIKLGVPVPYPADCILRNLISPHIAREVMYHGEFHQSDELLKMGLVDLVLPLEQVIPEAIEKAKLIGSSYFDAFSMIKRNRIEPIEQQIRKNLAERERYFVECWYSDVARKRLQEAAEKF